MRKRKLRHENKWVIEEGTELIQLLSFFCLYLLVCRHPFYAKKYRSQKKKNYWQVLLYTYLNHKNSVIKLHSYSREIHRSKKNFLWEFFSSFDANIRCRFRGFSNHMKPQKIQSLILSQLFHLYILLTYVHRIHVLDLLKVPTDKKRNIIFIETLQSFCQITSSQFIRLDIYPKYRKLWSQRHTLLFHENWFRW